MPDLTQLLRVGGIQYYIHNIASLQLTIKPRSSTSDLEGQGSFIPCTVINWAKDNLETEALDAVLNSFTLQDDVWNRSFLRVIVIRTPKSTFIRIGKCETIMTLTEASKDVPNGPYVMRSGSGDIFKVSKLFDDKYEAFIGGSVKRNGGSFEWLGIENCIAVPSRLYYEVTPTRLLSGLRFAVKDIIDINGLETGCGNRAYRGLYTKRTASAACVQRLLNAGAVFVGKTKTTQFAEGQTPLQWCDYTAPFNPRGDTYQSPSSSSAGSAVASAAYTWLDFTIATDTGGSIRHPAGICGIYGLRPSTNAVDTSGIYSVSSLIDSVGILARSASTVERVTRYLIDIPSPSVTSKVSYKLLYPVRANTSIYEHSQRWFPTLSNEVTDTEACFETTVQKLESYLRCKRTFVDIDDLWYNTHPVGSSNILNRATEGIYKALSTYTNFRQVIEPFINDYKAANTGHAPAIDPIVRARQAEGREITSSQYVAAVKSAELFSHWITNILLAPSEKEQIPLLIYPQSWGTPNYRDDLDSGPLFSSSFSIYSLSYISGAPDCTIPIGEVSRYSKVTDSCMLLPISISVVGRPGTDLALMALLAKLEYEGILRPVSTGSTLYPKSGSHFGKASENEQ